MDVGHDADATQAGSGRDETLEALARERTSVSYEEPLFFEVMEYAGDAERDVVDMVSGNPDWEPPEGIREGLRTYADADAGAFQYAPSAGLPELRERVAARHGVDAEHVVVTNGAGMANTLGMARALDRGAGDEVLTADPVYPYYPGKAAMLGGVHRGVPTDEDGRLDPADVRAAASEETACIVVNTPNNPTGRVYREETMRELVAIAEERDALLVSDEVYERFDLTGAFASAGAIDSANVVVTNSFSKAYAITGFRVGYAVLPEAEVAAAPTRNMLTNVSTSRPAQRAVVHAMETTDRGYHEANRERLRERIEAFTAALDRTDATYTTPEGAFYVLARFPDFPGTLANAKHLIDDVGVAGMPGEAFGETRAAWFRFALVTPRVETAAERLVDYFA